MAELATGRPGSLLLLSFAQRPSERIVKYVLFMTEQGVSVDFVLWDEQSWREADLPPGVRTHQVRQREHRLLTQKLKRFFLYQLPGAPFGVLRCVTDSNPLTRAATPVVARAHRLVHRAGGAVEKRIFDPFYRILRPFLLAGVAEGAIRGRVDLKGVTRIVSTETYSITYAWRLAKRLPRVATTIYLDRGPLPPVAG